MINKAQIRVNYHSYYPEIRRPQYICSSKEHETEGQGNLEGEPTHIDPDLLASKVQIQLVRHSTIFSILNLLFPAMGVTDSYLFTEHQNIDC